MVTVILRGGLGNQMFQYAAGLGLARAMNAPLVLDTTYLNDRFPRPAFAPRTYDLDIFSLSPQFVGLSKISTQVPIPGFWLGLDLVRYIIEDAFGTTRLMKEGKKNILDSTAFAGNKNIALWGFWQNEKYFAGVKGEVRTAFTFREPLSGDAAALAEEIKKSESVAVHVRRGDYALPKREKQYGKTNLDYYARAAEYVSLKINNPHFFIFSDDIAWCKENLKFSGPGGGTGATTTYVDSRVAGPKASYHLHLQTLCKHNIIANSSFSWWGAWLNANPKKIVVAPKQWFMGSLSGGEDIVPAAWVRI